jgi:hypothetical protein
MTEDDFRRLALALPGAVEGSHMGHPDFRAGGPQGPIFASLSGKDPVAGMVRLPLDLQQAFLAESPEVYHPASGAWGLGGATMVRLAAARVGSVRLALRAAWERATEKPVTPKRRAPARRRPRPRAR